MITFPKATLSLIIGEPRVELAENPTRDDGWQTILTHLQKYSHFGFMITWPFCFHFWLFWRLQLQDHNPESLNPTGWLPGTEQGIYFRTPGWRWDAELGMKPTLGYFGFHWD